MLVRVTCSAVVIGVADFDPARGLACAELIVSDGYDMVADAARGLGELLEVEQHFSPVFGDFADVAARLWSGDRLALEDEAGREHAVNNVVVVEQRRRGHAVVRVVADFRPDLARVEAFLRTLGPAGRGRNRPAA
jgi:hypothetical protein